MARVVRPLRRSRGSVLVYTLVALIAFSSVVALAIDASHARVVKMQLQTAADAAVRAAGWNLQFGASAAQNAAVAAAAANTADGTPVVVVPSTDIDFGTWSNHTFTVLSGSAQSGATAIRVRCVRSASRQNAVAATFGSFLGFTSTDITATAIAVGTPTPMAGFIGYSGITMQNNTFWGGYSSSTTTSPTENSANSKARVGSNGSIQGHQNDSIHGDAVLGPSASVSGPTVTGTTYTLSSAIPVTTLATWSPGNNPGGVAQSYTVSSTTVLPGGTYWFTSLTINANLTFSGAAVVYVNGPITVAATLTPASGVPGDLKIYQYGNNTFGDSSANGMNVTAAVYAPGCDFVAKNNLTFAGSAIFNTITTKNNADFFYDTQLGLMNGSNTVATVQ